MHRTHTAVYDSLPQQSHGLWRGTIDVGDGLAGSVVGLGSAPSRARTSEEDATSADGLTEGGGSGPSQRCTGRLFLHALHKQSADTLLALHSEVLRFRPIDGEVAHAAIPSLRKFLSRHLWERAFPAKSGHSRRHSQRRSELRITTGNRFRAYSATLLFRSGEEVGFF
jgi:hypothetical protein